MLSTVPTRYPVPGTGYSIEIKWASGTQFRLITFSGGTCLRGVQGNPNKFPILVQGDAVHGIGTN